MWGRIKLSLNTFMIWLKAMHGGGYVTVFLILAIMGVGLYFSYDFHWETQGEIIVDEPKVYTRERLVNDRFREEAWLNEQLNKPKPEDFLTAEARLSSVNAQQSKVAANLAISDGTPVQNQANATTLKPEALGVGQATQHISSSPTDTFIDMLDYRDKVRTELMRIQLDDRHDIEGNTLYRLNFDSAVLPGEHTHESAVILVTVTPDKEANNTTENQDTLFKEWAIDMQTMVNKLITDKAKVFTDPNAINRADYELPREEQIAFDGFLRKNICAEVVKLSQKLDERQDINSQHNKYEWLDICPEPKASDKSIVSQNTSSSIVYYDCDKHPDSFFCEVEKLIGRYSQTYELVNLKSSYVIYLERLKKEKLNSTASYKDAVKLGDKIANDCKDVNPPPRGVPYNPLWNMDKLQDKPKNKQHKNLEHKTLSDEEKAAKVDYPCFQNPPRTNRLVLAMGLLARLYSLSTMGPQKLYNLIDTHKSFDHNSIKNYPKVIEELARPYVCEAAKDPKKPEVSEKSSFFSFPPAESYLYLNDSYTKKYTEQCMSEEYPNNGINQKIDNIKQLMANYQATRLNKLDDYFTATLQGCDMQSCGLALNAKPDARLKLTEALDDVTQSFSYAVTPQMQAQRIAILNKQKEQLNIRINAALLAGSNKADSLINQLSTVEKELEALERHPLVIGFGDWKDDKKASINKKVTREITEIDNIISNLEKIDDTASQDNSDKLNELNQLASLINKELKIADQVLLGIDNLEKLDETLSQDAPKLKELTILQNKANELISSMNKTSVLAQQYLVEFETDILHNPDKAIKQNKLDKEKLKTTLQNEANKLLQLNSSIDKSNEVNKLLQLNSSIDKSLAIAKEYLEEFKIDSLKNSGKDPSPNKSKNKLNIEMLKITLQNEVKQLTQLINTMDVQLALANINLLILDIDSLKNIDETMLQDISKIKSLIKDKSQELHDLISSNPQKAKIWKIKGHLQNYLHKITVMNQLSLIDNELKILESDTFLIKVGGLRISKPTNEVRQLNTKRIEELYKKKNQLSQVQTITEDSVDMLPDSHYNSNELIVALKALRDELQRVPNIETHFGWIIQPRLTESKTSPEKIEYRQIPGHYSLSAIISIPSWWRTLKVQVNKCWLSNPTLGTSNSGLCDQKDIPPAFSIKVPGNAHDINQKLGFEVLKTPYIVIDDDPNKGTGDQELEVGRKGVVLLNGERLWRSTVIMVGSQKADSIEVLPDMKAVMATFKCVNPAAGDKVSAYKDATQAAGNVLFDNADLFFQGHIEALKLLLKLSDNKQTNLNDPPSSAGANPDNCKGTSQPSESNPKQDCKDKVAVIKLWTSEGNTNNAPSFLKLKPFVQRFPTDKPCYEFEENKQARKSDDS